MDVGTDIRGKFSASVLESWSCKFCRRTPLQVGWCRPDGGRECGECRNLLRSLFVGDKEQKHEQKSNLERKCKDNSFHSWFMSSEGPLGKFRSASRDEKRSMTSQILERKVSVVNQKGFLMREVRGVFWPRALYESNFQKTLHPQDMVNLRQMDGIILPRNPSEPLPIGTFELFNDDFEFAEKRDTIHDSGSAKIGLIEGQDLAAFNALVANATSCMESDFKFNEQGQLESTKCEQSPEDKDKSKQAAKKKPRKASEPSESDDEWFSAIPKRGGSFQIARKQPRQASMGGAAARPGGGASSSGAAASAGPLLGSHKMQSQGPAKSGKRLGDGLSWRDRAAKLRKISSVDMTLKVASEYVSDFSTRDDLRSIKAETLATHLKKLNTHRGDDNLTKLLCDATGSLTPDGIELRQKIDMACDQLSAVQEVLASMSDCEDSAVNNSTPTPSRTPL